MQPVMERTMPIVFRADGHLQMLLAMGLCDEFGLRGVIDGATEAHRVVNELAAKKTPLIVRLDFPPEPKRDDKKTDDKKTEGKKGDKPTGEAKPEEAAAKAKAKDATVADAATQPEAKPAAATTVAAEPVPEKPADKTAAAPAEEQEPEPLFVDRKRRYDEAVKNAAVLHEHGLPFALTTAGAENPKKFFERLRLAVKAGLPEEAALRALTETPAELFGASEELGTLEPGKLAHVVAFDGAFLEESAQVRYAFVDGRKFEMKAKPKKKDKADDKDKAGGDATSIAGTWTVTVDSPEGSRRPRSRSSNPAPRSPAR
jgi:hypothetical protein